MCEYAAEIRQDLACDKFVVGLIEDRTKERLLHKEKLDLSTAVAIAQRVESSGKQMREMSTTAHTEINVMHRSRGQTNQNVCYGNCGHHHKPRQCPAYGQECSFCHKANHFSKVCRSRLTNIPQQKSQQLSQRNSSTAGRKVQEIEKTVNELTLSSEDSQDLFMDPIKVDGLHKSQSWFSNINTNGGQLHCKLDTGAGLQ